MQDISTMFQTYPIVSMLPEGFENKAQELKAFSRKGDYIKTVLDLILVLLLWADLGTYGLTSAYLRTMSNFPMSKVALYKRVKASAAFLQWLVVNFCYKSGYLVPKPDYLEKYRPLVVDATKSSKPGSNTADYTLHTMIELFSLSRVEQHLTDATTGESMTNFNDLLPNDLVIADRAYGTIKSMRWVEEKRAFYIFRMKAKAFSLYVQNEKGYFVQFDLTEKLKDWKENKLLEYHLFYRQGSNYYPVRICALGKTAKAIEQGSERIKRSNNGANRTKVTALQAIYNQYIVVISDLPQDITTEQILSLYRQRWQIELVFKRLKSILDFDKLQTKQDATSNAWFYCKLLTAAICENYIQCSSFPPSKDHADELPTEIIMDGIRSYLHCPVLTDS